MFGNDLYASERAVKFIGSLCSLKTLLLSETNLNYNFSDIVQSFSACPHKPLESLDLSINQVWGSIPHNIESFSSLTDLLLYLNQLNGTITPALRRLTMLVSLDLRYNSLNGTLTNAHLSNLPELLTLGLGSNNKIIVDIIENWIPPFQLEELDLSSCKIGPHFPKWLLTQKNLNWLDISNAGILDAIPDSLWHLSFLSRMEYLNMSRNMIYGTLPNVSIIFNNSIGIGIDLSYNNLKGAIPLFLRNNVSLLYLNNNKFAEGLVPFLCPKTKIPLTYLDLSNNLFSEKLPNCWMNLNKLFVLNLENNCLQGNLPTSIGALDKLGALHLSNNNLSGALPPFLANCTSLVILDLANNLHTGYIPQRFGDSFKSLSILILQSNHFFGTIPSRLCKLSQLQLLDLSNNHISGTIPRCLDKLKGMTNKDDLMKTFEIYWETYVNILSYDNARLMWKSKEQSFNGRVSLRQLRAIDISNNKLEGQIPEGISSLVGLASLNLSRNNLSGAITSRIGQLSLMESLDLSNNHLSGTIPTSLAEISNLGVLDLSYNNLSGKIPIGTQLQSFNASFYTGNPELCGAPLPECYRDEAPNTSFPHKKRDRDEVMLGLIISVEFVGL